MKKKIKLKLSPSNHIAEDLKYGEKKIIKDRKNINEFSFEFLVTNI